MSVTWEVYPACSCDVDYKIVGYQSGVIAVMLTVLYFNYSFMIETDVI